MPASSSSPSPFLFSVHICLLCLLLTPLSSAAVSSTYTWVRDNVTITATRTTTPGDPTAFTLKLRSNRLVTEGGFRLSLIAQVNQNYTNKHTGTYYLNTSCLPYHATPKAIEDQLNSLLLQFHQGRFSSPPSFVPQARVTRRATNASAAYDSYGHTYKVTGLSQGSFRTNVTLRVWGAGSAVGCDSLVTYANWSDSSQWDLLAVPGATHKAVIYQGSGVIALTKPVIVSKLVMSGGTLLLGQSGCGDKWTPSSDGVRKKCFKAFSGGLLNRDEAERACQGYAPQSRGHLARVESKAENRLVRGLCRNGGVGGEGACWIGLREAAGQDQDGWGWEEESTMLDATYRTWGWLEPNNLTHPDGYESCSAIQTSTQDPFMQATASWVDQDCFMPLSYICEKWGQSTPYSLTVTSSFQWHGGVIQGPGNITNNGTSSITAMTSQVIIRDSAWLLNRNYLNVTARAVYGVSSYIANYKTLKVANGSTAFTTYVANNSESNGFPPILYNSAKGTLLIGVPTGIRAQIGWIFKNYGTVKVHTGFLDLVGGGFSLGGVLSVVSPHAIRLGNQSFQMMQPASQQLTLNASHPISDVSQGYGQDQAPGVFRLSFGSSYTTCLPYHVSAQDLQAVLNSLPTINAQGNVTVFRNGRGSDQQWGYGYKHLIVFDRASGYNRTVNSAISLYCSGSKGGCGCVDPAADFLYQGSDTFSCAAAGQNSSATVSSRCTMKPTYSIKILNKGAEQTITGTGALCALSSTHLLPSRIGCNTTAVYGGVAIVSSRFFRAQTVSVYGGRLFLVGTGYDGMDLARISYADQTSYGRRRPILSSDPPPMYGVINRLEVSDGTFAVTSKANDLSLKYLYWTGGTLSGRVKLRVMLMGRVNGTTTKRLRNGIQLWNMGPQLQWDNCDLMLSEGSSLNNAGTLWITGKKAMRITQDLQHQGWYPGRSWDDQGWYVDPLCGDRCTATPYVENIATGMIKMLANTTASIQVPLLQRGKVMLTGLSRFEVGAGGYNNGTLNIGQNATYCLSQGSFNFSSASNVTNKGTLEVVDGFHRAPATFTSRVTVRGGSLYFPSRGVLFKSNVSVLGGMLRFSQRQQNISILGNFTLEGGSVVYRDDFHLYRDHRVWDDRVNLTIWGAMVWRGGVVDGNLNVLCETVLDMDGTTKYLMGGVQVIYHGLAYWGTGDIITQQDSTLLHRGVLQLKNALNFTARLAHAETFDDSCTTGQSHALLQWDE